MEYIEEDASIIQHTDNKGNSESFGSTVNSSFFCTNEKAFEKMDNNEIFQYIVSQYETLNQNNEDYIIKKTIVAMLNNEQFIANLLDYYNISAQDIFKILYSQYSNIFKGPYLKKLHDIVEQKNYR